MMWAKLRAPAGMGANGDICDMIRIVGVKVAIWTEVMESVPSGLKGSSYSLAADRAAKAVDGGCFLGVLCRETEAGVMGKPVAIAPWPP